MALGWTTRAMVGWTVLCAIAALLWAMAAPLVVLALMGAVYWAGMTAIAAAWLMMRPIPIEYVPARAIVMAPEARPARQVTVSA